MLGAANIEFLARHSPDTVTQQSPASQWDSFADARANRELTIGSPLFLWIAMKFRATKGSTCAVGKPLTVLPMKIISKCRQKERQVYYCCVLSIKQKTLA